MDVILGRTQTGSATASIANASFTSVQTVYANHSGSSSYSLYESGDYSNDSLSLSSYSASGSGTDCLSLTVYQTQSSLQTSLQSGTQSNTYTGSDPSIGYNSQSGANFTAVVSSTIGLTLTLTANLNYSFSQQGEFNNDSFNLTAVTSNQAESATQSSTSASQSSTTLDGTNHGTFSLGNLGAAYGDGTFHNTDSGIDTLQDYRTLNVSIYAAGNASYGLALSSFNLTESSFDSQSESRQDTGTESFTGSSQSGPFSGLGTTTTGDSVSQSSGVSWSELGQLTNNAWSMSSLSYTITQGAGFTYSQDVKESWAGSFSGNDHFSVSGTGTGTLTETGQGCYSNGSYALSSYSLTGSSQGTFNSNEAGATGSTAFDHSDEVNQSMLVNEQAVYNHGSFSYGSYCQTNTTLETQSDQAGAANDSKVTYQQVKAAGTGHTGMQTTTSWGTYTFNSRDPETYTDSSTMPLTLQGVLDLQQPESGLMPLGAMPLPVTVAGLQGAPNASLVVASGGDVAWMSLYFDTNGSGSGWVVNLAMGAMPSGLLTQLSSVGSSSLLAWKVQLPQLQGSMGGTSGILASGGPWSVLQQGGSASNAVGWSWQRSELLSSWNVVGMAETGSRWRSVMAQPSLDPMNMSATRSWEQAIGGLSANGSATLNNLARAADATVGFIDGLTNSLLSKINRMSPGTASILSVILPGVGIAASGLQQSGVLSQVNYWNSSYSNGVVAGRIVGIALSLLAPTGGVLGAVNLGLMGANVASSTIDGIEAARAGSVKGVVLSVLSGGLAVVHFAPLCKTSGVLSRALNSRLAGNLATSVGRGLGLYGVYQNLKSADANFKNGNFVDGLLDVAQAGTDAYTSMRSCFTCEMLLDAEGRKKRADAIVVGDLLWSRDEHDPDGPLVLKRVLRRFVRLASIWNLGVSGQVLRTTGEHPFWVENRYKWLVVNELQVGDLVRTRCGLLLPVQSVENTGKWERVYNWEIEEYHTYFVSATEDGASIWAHNTGCTLLDQGNPAVTELRRRYLGETPRKGSKVYKKVVQRMMAEGSIRENPTTKQLELKGVGKDGATVWRPLSEGVNMGHKVNAVKWWNKTGRFYGARSPEAYRFMRDPNNYVLQFEEGNKSSGASLRHSGQEYLPPAWASLPVIQ